MADKFHKGPDKPSKVYHKVKEELSSNQEKHQATDLVVEFKGLQLERLQAKVGNNLTWTKIWCGPLTYSEIFRQKKKVHEKSPFRSARICSHDLLPSPDCLHVDGRPGTSGMSCLERTFPTWTLREPLQVTTMEKEYCIMLQYFIVPLRAIHCYQQQKW